MAELNEEQREAVETTEGYVRVVAKAGSNAPLKRAKSVSWESR